MCPPHAPDTRLYNSSAGNTILTRLSHNSPAVVLTALSDFNSNIMLLSLLWSVFLFIIVVPLTVSTIWINVELSCTENISYLDWKKKGIKVKRAARMLCFVVQVVYKMTLQFTRCASVAPCTSIFMHKSF